MAYDFVAIDFETANECYNSACSIGIAAMRGGIVVDKFYSLIRPQGCFDAESIDIHGITESDVSSAPTAIELLDTIQHFFSPHWPIVAHNAYFDMSVLRESFHINEDELWYVDSMNLCKPFVGANKSLVDCASHFGIFIHNHHNALDDAIVCALIAQSAVDASEYNCKTLMELLAKDVEIKRYQMATMTHSSSMARHNNGTKPHKYPSYPKPSEIFATVSEIDTYNPLFGKNVVFTGELSISRAEAMQIAVNAGAVIKGAVSSKTDFLVVGKQDISLVGDDGMSKKEEKAYELNASGKANVKVLSESDFLHIAESTQPLEV